MTDRFLVTGALGCIGAWVVRTLLAEGTPVTIFDVGGSTHRLRLTLTSEQLAQAPIVQGDITDLNAVEKVIGDHGITHIIHLAALQIPFCRADPPLGAAVNVVGTVNLFEAAKRANLQRIVYASSIAVYGRKEEYEPGALQHDALLHPSTHYGVFKQANEGTARVYWQDNGVQSVGLRPYSLYGPGRDQGLTSHTTKAMVAAAVGEPYHIPFGGIQGLQYTADVAEIFVRAARVPVDHFDVYNLRGSIVEIADLIEAIEEVEPEAAGRITAASEALPLPEDVDDSPLRALLGAVPETPLIDGVAQSIALFRTAIAEGRLDPATYLS